LQVWRHSSTKSINFLLPKPVHLNTEVNSHLKSDQCLKWVGTPSFGVKTLVDCQPKLPLQLSLFDTFTTGIKRGSIWEQQSLRCNSCLNQLDKGFELDYCVFVLKPRSSPLFFTHSIRARHALDAILYRGKNKVFLKIMARS